MQRPKESKIGPEDLVRYQTDYCSKIYAGVGMPTWSNQIRNMLPMAFWTHQLRLAPFDAGFADAKAKVKIHEGDRIEISIGLVLSRRVVRDTTLGALALVWEDMQDEHQTALRTLRENGQLYLQYQGGDTNQEKADRFESFEDLVILLAASNLSMVRRVGNQEDSNCRLNIHSSSMEGTEQGSVVLELIATRDIQIGEVLTLNLPRAGSRVERFMLKTVLGATRRPYYAGAFAEESVDDSIKSEL
jgi:hypothetical protein